MLVELSVVEQRYHAVMEVVSGGIPVVEVAERYGVSRKTVHAWLRRYRQDGLPGLTDRSHRPHHHPGRLCCIGGKQTRFSAALPRSDDTGEFCEDRREPIASTDISAEFVVAEAQRRVRPHRWNHPLIGYGP